MKLDPTNPPPTDCPDGDTDGDGVCNGNDFCYGDDNIDTDGDGVPDDCDVCAEGPDSADEDLDQVPDACDLCPGQPDDGPDADEDTVPDACDKCPGADDLLDADLDGTPDCQACADGNDADGDGVCDADDKCPDGNDADDADGDGVPDKCDQCPGKDDTKQSDIDGDGKLDCDAPPQACEGSDTDGDGQPDACDVCPTTYDPEQKDSDGYVTIDPMVHMPVTLSDAATSVTLDDDEVSGQRDIGFKFNFFGKDYEKFYIWSNGLVSFAPPADGKDGCCEGGEIPNSDAASSVGVAPMVALLWNDLSPNQGGTIRYETLGSAPNRKLVVAFEDVPYYDPTPSGSTPTVSVQAVLHEDGAIDLHAIDVQAYNGGVSTRGIQNEDGTVALHGVGESAADLALSESSVRFRTSPDPDGVGDMCRGDVY